MCGRYTTAAGRVKFDDIFKPAAAEKAVENAIARYNVAPTQQVAIIERTAENERRATTARWSLLPRWAKSIKDRPQWINARSDKVLTSKVWRSLAARPEGRVLIPADGWYEWTHAEEQRNGPKPAPFRHQVDDGGWFAFAGLRSHTRVADVEGVLVTARSSQPTPLARPRGCTTECRSCSPTPRRCGRGSRPNYSWTTCPSSSGPIAGDRITVEPASTLVNSARNDGPELLEHRLRGGAPSSRE